MGQMIMIRQRLVRWAIVCVLLVGHLALPPSTQAAAGGTPTTPGIADLERSCAAIYNEITLLLKQKDNHQSSFFSSRYNRAAAYTASTFTDVVVYPALGYLAFATVVYFYKHAQVPDLRERIETLRTVSAQKLCFIK